MSVQDYREIEVPAAADGMRLDRFLAARFGDRSRSFFAQRIRAGEVSDGSETVLNCSHRVATGHRLRLRVEGIAPSGPPPPFPEILLERPDLVAVNKPPGLLCHPAGTRFAWAAVSLAKTRYPEDAVDLVHRLDRDTSGVLLLTRCADMNRHLKSEMKSGRVFKEYVAMVKGDLRWRHRVIDAPIGAADGPIRIQMAVRSDGLPATTEVTVEARGDGFTLVRCVLHTGRTHQIRVHLAHVGHPVVGDRMYGVSPGVFLGVLDHGVTEDTMRAAGAPRQALHARLIRAVLPSGETVEVRAPCPPDLVRWWQQPRRLPMDDASSP